MKYAALGSTGTQVSRICLGTMSFGSMADWMISEADSFAIVKKALESGINFFDTADAYSRGQSEQILGRALKEYGARRDEIVVATKCFVPMAAGPNRAGLSRKHIMHAIDDSLKRLGMDYIDLYQIHRFDYHTPIDETIEVLNDVVKAGKALYVGASSMLSYQFAKYLLRADARNCTRFVTMQNQYSLLYREEEREMNPLCREEGVGLLPWGPLAGGRLAGNRQAGTTRSKTPMYAERFNRPEDEAVIKALNAVADARGVSPVQVALAWLLAKPGVTAPIIGATKVSQLDAPIAAVELSLSSEEMTALEAAYVSQPPVGNMPSPSDPPIAAPRA